MDKKFLRNRTWIVAGSVALLIACFLIGSNFYVKYLATQTSPDAFYACISTNVYGLKDYDPNCLSGAAATLLRGTSTVALIDSVMASDLAPACHFFAHIIGRETFRRSGAIEQALSVCPRTCNFGCMHGAIAGLVEASGNDAVAAELVAHAASSTIQNIAMQFCNISGVCHALGHMLYLESEDVARALAQCAQLPVTSYGIENCRRGIFMEHAGGKNTFAFLDGNEGAGTLEANYQRSFTFCPTLPIESQHACFAYALLPPVDKSGALLGDPREFCTSLPQPSRSFCIGGLKWPIRSSTSDVCAQFKTIDDRNACTMEFAREFIDPSSTTTYAKALQYCMHVTETPRDALCFHALFQHMDEYGFSDDAKGPECERSQLPRDICTKRLTRYFEVQHDLPQYRFGIFGDLSEKKK